MRIPQWGASPRLSFIATGLLIGILGATTAAEAQIVTTFTANRDNTLYESTTGAFSNGAGSFMFVGTVGNTGGGDIRRALVGFNVSSIPPLSRVTRAVLTLHMSRTISGAQTIQLRRVARNWGEGSSNANAQEGMGAPATTNDATWIHSTFPGTRWSQAGGDFVTTVSDTASVAGIGDYTWTSAQMATDVQAWVNNPAANFGWILIGNEAAPGTAKRFDTSENPTASFRPTLEITWTPIPEPGSIALAALGMGSLGLLAARRHRSGHADRR
jgi:hypothetical protein